jgi:hypothetical protein
MSYMHPAALAARRKYWTRPDAYRFAPPGTPEAKMPGWLDPSATRVRLKEAQEEEARAAFAAEVKALQAQQDRLCEMLAELKYEFAWRRMCRKYGYNPDQPRVPAGSGIESGRWAADPQFTRLAASRLPPTLGHNSGNLDIPPESPEDSRERTGAIRAAARILAKIPGPIGRATALVTIFEGASWLREHQAEIETQLDPPKTLEELHQAVNVDRPGTQKHHIVEQGPAEKEGFLRSQIDAPDNLVRIPKQKHQEISDWYSRKNVEDARFDGQSPRDWLRNRSWAERREFGLKVLEDFGVLKR